MEEIKRPRIISYTGNDPETVSEDCSDALVITDDGKVYFGGDSVGGLQEEDISGMIEGNHTYSIDFGTDVVTVTDVNMFGAVNLTKVVGYNVSSISYYVQNSGSSVSLTLTNGVWEGSKSIPANAVIMWTITRTNSGNAAIGIKITKA